MWQAIKTAAGTLWFYTKQVPSALKAAPATLDWAARKGLGILSYVVTEQLKVQQVSAGWNTWREHFLYGGTTGESSGKEPFSSATYPMEDKPKTASLVDKAYKMGATSFLNALSVGLVLLMGPAAMIPLAIFLGLATVLRFSGYMDPKLYKLMGAGLAVGLVMGALVGLTLLFPPLLALPLVGGALAMATSTTGLLLSLGLMGGVSLLATSVAGLFDDGLKGAGRSLLNLVALPLNLAIYGLSALASFAWDAFWWPFHGFYNDVYDPVRDKIRENWPKFTQALGTGWNGFKAALARGWGGLNAGVTRLVSWLRGRWGSPEMAITAEIDDVSDAHGLSTEDYESSDDETEAMALRKNGSSSAIEMDLADEDMGPEGGKTREKWQKFTQALDTGWNDFKAALARGWRGLNAGRAHLVSWLRGRWGNPEVAITAEIDDASDAYDLSPEGYESSDDKAETVALRKNRSRGVIEMDPLDEDFDCDAPEISLKAPEVVLPEQGGAQACRRSSWPLREDKRFFSKAAGEPASEEGSKVFSEDNAPESSDSKKFTP